MSLYLGTTPIASTGYDKANTDLSNLTNTGKNIANWSNNVTNCITNIPQDIKLELNNGTLTLKAGSKVYVPNGFEQDGTTQKFKTAQSTTDLSYSTTWGAGYQCLIIAYVDDSNNISAITMCRSDLAFSGTTAPSTTIDGSIWYDTSVNKIKVYRSGAWIVDSTSGLRTLFLGVVTVGTGNVITSIDQIFNGFGIIGSTIFALPGVKGLIPNGRNEDGTLKNTEFAVSNVITRTWDNSTTISYKLFHNGVSFGVLNSGVYSYDSTTNYNYNDGGIYETCLIGDISFTSGKITSLTPKTAFHALDYNTPHIVDTYKNGTSWYRVYSDGWIEQGGSFNSNSITFLKTFTQKPHFIRSCFSTSGTNNFNYNTASSYFGNISNISTTGVTGVSAFGETLWYACGY